MTFPELIQHLKENPEARQELLCALYPREEMQAISTEFDHAIEQVLASKPANSEGRL